MADSFSTVAAEPAQKLVFLASKNVWETTNCQLKIEGSLHRFGNSYSCIRTLEVQTNSVFLIKRAKDKARDQPQTYYDIVKAQMLAGTCCKLFCQSTPPSCKPRFLTCQAYLLTNRPNCPVVLAEELVQGEPSKSIVRFDGGGGEGGEGGWPEEVERHKLAALGLFMYARAGRGLAIEMVTSVEGVWSAPVLHSKEGQLGGLLDEGRTGIYRWRDKVCRRYCPVLGVTAKQLLALTPEEVLERFETLGLFGAARPASLLETVYLGDMEATQMLLQAGVPVNVTDSQGIQATPLIVAADRGDVAMVQLLLYHSANVNSAALDGRTPLIAAAMRGRLQVVEILLPRGANLDDAEEHGATALAMAAQNLDVRMLQLLLDNGAAVDAPMQNGCTPLYLASRSGNTGVVSLLLQRKAAVNAPATDGTTSLIVASMAGHVGAVEALLRGGANKDLSSQFGTAAEAAAHNVQDPQKKAEVVAVLENFSMA